MERKEILGLMLVTNFNKFAEFHAISSQKLDNLKSEDEKLKILELIKFIYRNVTDDVLYSAVNESYFNPCLGHFISSLINIAMNDKYFKVKNEVIEIIDLIINRLNDYYKQMKKGHNPSDLLASFLPGISQFLMKMITKDEKQNKIVFINSLKALSSLFCCVYRNYEDGLSEKLEDYPFLMPRTKEWQLKSIDKLNIIIEFIERALINHQSIQVKESLINFSTILLFHIVDHKENHDFLSLISRNLFRIPLTLLYDEHESIQQLAFSFTQRVSKKFFDQNSNHFILEEHLMEDLFKLLDDFEKEISVYSEENIMKNFKLLCGYLNCFEQNKFNLIFFNQKDKLFNLLKLIFRFDFNRMSANLLPKEQTEFENIDWFEKKFYYFENKKMLNQLDILCGLITKLSDQNVLNDYLFENLANINHKNEFSANQITNEESSQFNNRSTNLLIISHLVKKFDTNQLDLQVINKLVDLLENQINEIDGNDQLFIDERFELILFCAILIELITNFAYTISENKKSQYFISTLYTIMACTGSTHLQIQINAKASLVKLTKIFNYQSLKEMIVDNIDYIISKMHIKINKFNDKENLYFVFKIVFECTDAEVCNYFDQTINNLLIAMDINYSIVNFERLAKVLLLIVRTFKRWFVDEKSLKEKQNIFLKQTENNFKIKEFSTDLIEFLKKRKQDKEMLEEFERELINEPVNEQTILDHQKKIEEEQMLDDSYKKDDEENVLPIQIDCTKRILEKCSNFLSYNLIQVRLIVLDIMVDGLDVLTLHEDSLLPTAHIVWESLIHRFKDEPIVLFKCTECLLKMAVNCGDFIRTRTIKQILPSIYSFLKLSWKKSCLIDIRLDNRVADLPNCEKSNTNLTDNNCLVPGRSVKNLSNPFFHSLEYRLQQMLLEQLGKLAFHIRLSRKDLWPLILILIQYSNEKQPIELRIAAYSSLSELEYLDAYAVHYFKNYHS